MATPAGIQTLSVNQQPGQGTDYPFVSRPPDSLRYLLGDLWLSYQDDLLAFVQPFRVAWMYGFGNTTVSDPLTYVPLHARDVVIVDANDTVVFATTVAGTDFLETAWGNSLTTLQWIRGQTVLRLTRRTNAFTLNLPVFIFPDDAVLDARTHSRLPLRVRSIKVGDTTMTAKTVELKAGYNIKLTATAVKSTDGGRRVRRITIRARPGDGLGRLGGCGEEDPDIKQINGSGPDASGNLVLEAGGCYRLQRPMEVTQTSPRMVTISDDTMTEEDALAALALLNDCGPCCTCDDFVRTYEGIRRLFTRYQALGVRAEAVRDQMGDNIDRWNAQKDCRKAQNLRLVLNPEPRGVLFVGGLYCNTSGCCAVPLVLRTTFEGFSDGEAGDTSGTFDIKCGENRRSGSDTAGVERLYKPQTVWPVMDHLFDFADPRATSSFRNRVQFPDVDTGVVFRVTLSLHMPQVYDPQTGEPCDIPKSNDVVVPDAVAAIWATVPPLYPVRALVQKTVPVSQTEGCCP